MFDKMKCLGRQMFGGIRSLSTAADKKLDPSIFVQQRKIYKEELKALRKTWTTDINARNQQLANERAAKDEKVVLAKAMGLREKRKQSAARQAADKDMKLKAATAFNEHLAKNMVIHEERQRLQAKRHEELSKEYAEESKHWLTVENVDSRITLDFFDTPSTTGLCVADSEHWRYGVHSINLDRFRSGLQNTVATSESSLEDRLDMRKQNISSRHLLVQDFLDPLISTGSERAQYRDLMKKFSKQFDANNSYASIDAEIESAATAQADIDAFFSNIEGNAEERKALLGEDDEADDEPYDDPAAAKQEANRKAALQAGKGRVVKGRMARKQATMKKNGVAQTPIGVDVERTSPTGLPFKQATSEKLLSGLPG